MAQTTSSTELPELTPSNQCSQDPENEIDSPSPPDQTSELAPTDGGKAAWRLLLASYIFEALLWGFPLSFGIFQEYYSRIPQFQGNRYITVVGTTASGITYLGAPLVTPLVRRWSRYRPHMIWVGWSLCIASLVAGSFANELGTLVLTQGVMYGVGYLVLAFPIISMVDEFWVRRRGMAYGFLCSASGVSGAVIPLILQALLKRLGYHTTLRIVAAALAALTGPLIPCFKGRIGRQHTIGLRTDWTFLRKSSFWIYSTSNLLMGLGYFFPSLHLPSYAREIGLSTTNGALLLALMSISQVAGTFTFGYLSDKLSLNTLIMISSCVAATATLSVWGVAQSMLPLVVFSLLYGFFGAAYTAMWARMVIKVSDQPASSQAMFGLFNAGKGIGNVLAGPIGAGLVNVSSRAGRYGLGTYKVLVLFTGVCWLLSASSLGAMYLRPKVRRAER